MCQKTLLAHPWSVAALELPVRTASKDVRRAAVCVVARIAQKLIIETQPRGGRDGVAVIGLENRLGPIVGQLPVADQDAEAAGVEERDVSVADTVDDAGNPDRIIDNQGGAAGFDQADFISNNLWATPPLTPDKIKLVQIALVASQPRADAGFGETSKLQIGSAGLGVSGDRTLSANATHRRRMLTKTVDLRNIGF